MDALEYALESRLSDVRKQKSEIVQRRKGIQQLVERYLMNINASSVLESSEEDCSTLWRKHPLLSTPKTWIDLHERKILEEQAFKVAHNSISSTYKKQKRNAKGNKSITHTINTDVATDGETYGHHHKHGEMALAFCLDYMEKGKEATLTNYAQYLIVKKLLNEPDFQSYYNELINFYTNEEPDPSEATFLQTLKKILDAL